MEILSVIGALLASGWIWALLLLFLLPGTIFTVPEREAYLVQRFGKHVRTHRAGLNIKIPIFEQIIGKVSLRIRQMDVDVETKTQDNVFVRMVVSVQYVILPEKVEDAFYKLTDPLKQIESYVFDVVRSQVPKLTLDTLFENKDDIATAVKKELADVMDDFGYDIIKSLVTDIDPEAKVKAAMNQINTEQRLRIAAKERADATYIEVVRAAEADAESKRLQGLGIAQQRFEISKGLSEAVTTFREEVGSEISSRVVMDLLTLVQYFDALKDIGAGAGSKVILVPHSPGVIGDLTRQIQEAVSVGHEMSSGPSGDAGSSTPAPAA